MPFATGKYRGLFEDTDVRSWHDNLLASSNVTAEVYLRTLGLYFELKITIPNKILEEAGTNAFYDGFIDFVREMERRGKAGSYIERFRKVVSSWLSHNRIEVTLKVNIRGRTETPTLQNERIPTVEEL